MVCSIQFSPDGRRVATGCNQAAHIYDAKTGTQIWYVHSELQSNTHLLTRSSSLIDPSLPKDGDLYIRSVRFSPDGEYLATGGEDQRVRVEYILFSIQLAFLHDLLYRFGISNHNPCVTYLRVTQTRSMHSIMPKMVTS